MSDIDFNRVGLLLHICDLSKQWPNLNGLHALAIKELESLSVQSQEIVAEQRKAEKDKAEQEASIAAIRAHEEREAAARQREEDSKPVVFPEGETQRLNEDPVVVERRI